MNERKQKIYNVLDSLTQQEIEDYINERKLNNKIQDLLNKIKSHREPSHFSKNLTSINDNFNGTIEKYIKLGEAWVIAFILVCCYDDKYKTKDIKDYMKCLIDRDKLLKEYVYDCMKDFD